MSTFCKYFNDGVCRSCDQIEDDYALQVHAKTNRCQSELGGFGSSIQWRKPELSLLTGFRNRAKLSVTGSLDAPIIGLVGEKVLDQGRELLSCPIHHPRINQLVQALKTWISQYRLTPYRIVERQGELKGVILFYSPMSKQMYLRFVLRSQECVVRIRKALPEMQAAFHDLVCVSANIQPIPHAFLEGPVEILLTNQSSILHQMGVLKFQLTPQAFVQTNVDVATRLYQTAAEWIGEISPQKATELFCGQGAFSFFAHSQAKEWLGIEVNASAVEIANRSANQMGYSHLRFVAADATNVLHELQRFSPDLVLVNPPRRGLSQSGVRMLLDYSPRDILYSSCDIETLRSDVENLAQAYEIKRVQWFDLFPHTSHFETLVWLVRRSA